MFIHLFNQKSFHVFIFHAALAIKGGGRKWGKV